MIKAFFAPYFSENNYWLLYLHKAFRRFSDLAIYSLTGAYFLEIGMSLPWVLMFFGLEFGLRGFLCPYGVALINRFGVVRSLMLSAIFKLLFFVMMSYGQDNIWIGFLSLILLACSSSIYFPLYDVLEAILVKDNHARGRQYSFGLIVDAIAGMLGVLVFAYLLVHYSYFVASIPVIISLFLSVLPFFVLKNEIDTIQDFKPHSIYSFIKDEFKPYIVPLFGFQLTIIASAVTAPIFIYTLVGEMEMLGVLVATSIAVELLVTLFFGRYVDSKGIKTSFRPSVLVHSGCMLGYILFAKTPFSLFLAESFHKISRNLLRSNIMTGLHSSYRTGSKHLLFYGASMQMTLCFFEFITLPLYALLAVLWGDAVLYLAFFMSAIGLLISAWYFWRQEA